MNLFEHDFSRRPLVNTRLPCFIERTVRVTEEVPSVLYEQVKQRAQREMGGAVVEAISDRRQYVVTYYDARPTSEDDYARNLTSILVGVFVAIANPLEAKVGECVPLDALQAPPGREVVLPAVVRGEFERLKFVRHDPNGPRLGCWERVE